VTELHPSDFPLLRAEFQKDSRARVDKADGYQQLKAKPGSPGSSAAGRYG
jgi:23S rRNA (adenine2030-N6)-methyltransferase